MIDASTRTPSGVPRHGDDESQQRSERWPSPTAHVHETPGLTSWREPGPWGCGHLQQNGSERLLDPVPSSPLRAGMTPFSVTIEYRDGAVLVRPSGELDVMTAPKLEQALVGVVGDGRMVLVDLSGVLFADCAGLRPIRRALEDGAEHATTVRIFGGRPKVERVLQLTGFRRPYFSQGG